MTTYTLAGLKARIADDLARSDLTTQIADAIEDSIEFFKKKRWYFNETRTATFATVAAQSFYDSSDDADIPLFLELDEVFITDTDGRRIPLDRRDPAEVHASLDNNAASGRPYCYAYFNQGFLFYPIPDAAYTITPMGHIEVAMPSTDDETNNVWMTEAFEMIRGHAKALLYTHTIKNAPDKKAEMVDAAGGAKNALTSATNRKKATGQIERTTF